MTDFVFPMTDAVRELRNFIADNIGVDVRSVTISRSAKGSISTSVNGKLEAVEGCETHFDSLLHELMESHHQPESYSFAYTLSFVRDGEEVSETGLSVTYQHRLPHAHQSQGELGLEEDQNDAGALGPEDETGEDDPQDDHVAEPLSADFDEEESEAVAQAKDDAAEERADDDTFAEEEFDSAPDTPVS